MSRVLVVDGCQLLWRGSQKNADMRNAAGEPSGCFVGAIERLLTDMIYLAHDEMVVVWDVGEPRWQRTIWPSYKTSPKSDPEAAKVVYAQMSQVQAYLRAAGVRQLGALGVEADVIISLVASGLASNMNRVTILAQDSDLHQVVDAFVDIYEPVQRRRVDYAWVEKKYGVMPKSLPDLFAISGQGGDDIPKVPGVGPKTAKKLLDQFVTLDGLLEAPRSELPKGKVGDALDEGRATLRIARQLIELPRFGHDRTPRLTKRLDDEEWFAIGYRMRKPLPQNIETFDLMSLHWGVDRFAVSKLLQQKSPSFGFWKDRNNHGGLRIKR
jgi:DNA polymerase-1